eukprot:232189-Prymnesium_polylepis.1
MSSAHPRTCALFARVPRPRSSLTHTMSTDARKREPSPCAHGWLRTDSDSVLTRGYGDAAREHGTR